MKKTNVRYFGTIFCVVSFVDASGIYKLSIRIILHLALLIFYLVLGVVLDQTTIYTMTFDRLFLYNHGHPNYG